MSETSIVTDEHQEGEIKAKKPQSESLKRAKAKYYSKKKLDPEFMEQNRSKSKQHYIQNAEHHNQKCRDYLDHKQDIYDQAKQRREKKKVDEVKAKLENMGIEHLARILIEARKTMLLD